MKKITLLFLLAIGMLWATERPTWVDNPSNLYPQDRYLAAVGDGDTRSDAENKATANLSKIFEARVKSDQSVAESYFELTKGSQSDTGGYTESNSKVNVQSAQTLLNVQMGQSYTDDSGRVYAIAYIDRVTTGNIYDERIRANNQKIMHYWKELPESSLLEQYSLLIAADIISKMNQVLIGQLQVLSPGFAGFSEQPVKPEVIHEKLVQTAKRISFSIEITNDRNDVVAGYIRGLLNEKGFVQGSNPVLVVKGNLKLEKIAFRDDLETTAWTISVNISDNKDNVLASWSKSDRESSKTLERAEARALGEISKQIKKNLINKVDDYFTNIAIVK